MTVPIGTIMAYGGAVDGTAKGQLESQGWLVCDGEAKSRQEYPQLFQVLGESFGHGDKLRSFNLPDLRGRFLRGVNHGEGHDPNAEERTTSATGSNKGDKVGSYQEDAIKTKTLSFSAKFPCAAAGAFGANESDRFALASMDPGIGYLEKNMDFTIEGEGSETRPKNIYVNYIIKAKNPPKDE